MPPWMRPNASFVHSYGPPSIVNALPTSAIRSMYGATNTTASTTSHRNPSGPFDATVPSVSSPTKAQMVKNTMTKRRSDLISLLFSASANAVVCSATAMDPPLGDLAPGFGQDLTENSHDLGDLLLTGDERRRDLDARVLAIVGTADEAVLEQRARQEAAQERLALVRAERRARLLALH